MVRCYLHLMATASSMMNRICTDKHWKPDDDALFLLLYLKLSTFIFCPERGKLMSNMYSPCTKNIMIYSGCSLQMVEEKANAWIVELLQFYIWFTWYVVSYIKEWENKVWLLTPESLCSFNVTANAVIG